MYGGLSNLLFAVLLEPLSTFDSHRALNCLFVNIKVIHSSALVKTNLMRRKIIPIKRITKVKTFFIIISQESPVRNPYGAC